MGFCLRTQKAKLLNKSETVVIFYGTSKVMLGNGGCACNGGAEKQGVGREWSSSTTIWHEDSFAVQELRQEPKSWKLGSSLEGWRLRWPFFGCSGRTCGKV